MPELPEVETIKRDLETKIVGLCFTGATLSWPRMLQNLTPEALSRRLGVMDQAAFSLCGENRIPIIVCQVFDADNLAKAVRGEKVGTLVTD